VCQVRAVSQKISVKILPIIWLFLFHVKEAPRKRRGFATQSDSIPPTVGTRHAEISSLLPMVSGLPVQLAGNT